MAARAYWQGQIRLALVSIPVQVFSATKSAARVSFNQIHKPSGKRIRYEKVVPGVGAVDADDIVKGYEVEKGKYVLITDEEIEDVKLEAKHTIDLIQFVDEGEIDPMFFEKPYFVAPDEDDVAGEAYVVLRDALKAAKKIGLGQLVARGQASVVALKAQGKGLIIETLRYADELQNPEQFFSTVPGAKPEKELLSLATELIERKAEALRPEGIQEPVRPGAPRTHRRQDGAPQAARDRGAAARRQGHQPDGRAEAEREGRRGAEGHQGCRGRCARADEEGQGREGEGRQGRAEA